MNPQNPLKPATEPVMKNALATMQSDEKVIFEIKRHPIGLLGAFVIDGLLLIGLAVFAFVVIPGVFPADLASSGQALAAVVFLCLAALSVIFLFIYAKVYWGNGWVLTSDSITQVSQTSLFNRQSSQLSLANLEDVTAEQNGILAHMFGYGVIKAETAGEHSKFRFPYCPNPNERAKDVLAAREIFEQKIEQHEVGNTSA